jgi:hypothetical protein
VWLGRKQPAAQADLGKFLTDYGDHAITAQSYRLRLSFATLNTTTR